jgi:hypothetical protein
VGSDDDLFADPLGVRKSKDNKSKQPPAAPSSVLQAGGGSQAQGPRGGAFHGRRTDLDDARENDLDMNLPVHRRVEIKMSPETPEEEPGLMASWFGYLLGAGTQCCGNRVRSDTEAVQRASATGRPPAPARQQQFPDATPKAPATSELPRSKRKDDSDYELEEDKHAATRAYERRVSFEPSSKRPADLDGLYQFAGTNDIKQKQPTQREQGFQFKEAPEQQESKKLPTPLVNDQPSKPLQPNSEQVLYETPQEVSKPSKWQWPTWSLNTKEKGIEVYVEDDDSGESRWCEATPQFRVVDKEGNDAYLCAEYEWDDDFYVQDFSPEHVRKRGQRMTVHQIVSLGSQASRTAQSGQRHDTGGGVSSWLGSDM